MDPVVMVGYAETLAGERALMLAADEAALRKVGLVVLTVFPDAVATVEGTWPDAQARRAAELIAARGSRIARELHPELPVQTRVLSGWPDEVLAEQSRGAELLVLGDREGRGSATGAEGTTTAHLLGKATCPVLILHPDYRREVRLITVGAAVAEPLPELLGFAFAEASYRGAALRVVNVWTGPPASGGDVFSGDAPVGGLGETAGREHGLGVIAAPWSSRYPDVPCDGEVRLAETTDEGLAAASRQAHMMIVGGRRHVGGEPGMAIGSVVHTLLRRAGCPLVVVPIG